MRTGHLKWIGILLAVVLLLWLVPSLLRDDGRGGTVDVESGFAFGLPDPVTRIDVIRQSTDDTIRLERSDGGWSVDGYVADTTKVAETLEVLDDLRSDILVARNPGNHPALGVAADTGRRVEVYTRAGGPLAFLLGNRDLQAGGYFVRLPGRDDVFRLEGPAGGYLTRDRADWRDRRIAAVDTAGIREIMIRRPEDEIVLRRAAEGWRVGDVPADTAAVAGLLRQLPLLTATGFLTREEADAIDFATPDAQLDVFVEDEGDVTGRQLALALHFVQDEARGDWIVRPADFPEVYRLPPYVVRRLLPERSDLLPAAEDEAADTPG